MFADFFATQRLAVTKCVIVNHTCSWRARLLVVGAALQIDRAVGHQRDAIRRKSRVGI